MNVKILTVLFWSAVSALSAVRPACAQQTSLQSDLVFQSSNADANQAFLWAKRQALAYMHPQSQIGPWYEAALPGRNAFCMRDVSHQTAGAAALGLFDANRNMLSRFAASAAASRNWAGYWEIDGKGLPSSFDYRSDEDFWFNLPANFDVLDAAVRMWRWTGDDSFRTDPQLRLFSRKTVTDYIAQWQLQPEAILTRPRIANQRLARGEFVNSRGIPSYLEGPKNFNVGADLLAAEYRGIRSYQEIAQSHEDRKLAARLQPTGEAIQRILENVAWSPQQHHFFALLQDGRNGSGTSDTYVLYFDAVKNPDHIRGALDFISDPAYWKTINIEEESYLPQVLFRYGRGDAAWSVLLDLSAPGKSRHDYPEVSYAVIAALISGAMGIEPGHADDDFDVQTLPQPISQSDNMSVAALRIKDNVIDIRHTGNTGTIFANRKGSSIRWKAVFAGTIDQLAVDGKWRRAEHGVSPDGVLVSWVIVSVPQARSILVSAEGR